MNTKKIILIVSGGILLTAAGIGAYHLWFKDKGDPTSPDLDKLQKDLGKKGGEVAAPGEGEFSANTKQEGKYKGGSGLIIGDEGRKVALLQALLNHYENANLTIDGAFGNATRTALSNSGFTKCNPTLSKVCTAASVGITYGAIKCPTCKITNSDLLPYLTKTKTDATFNKNYNVATNKQIKAVYAKYSS